MPPTPIQWDRSLLDSTWHDHDDTDWKRPLAQDSDAMSIATTSTITTETSSTVAPPPTGVPPVKALSCRIVHSFADHDRHPHHRTAYSIWVYDAETGREWYAPIRYWNDFQDLSKVCQHLSNNDWGFPKPKWFQKPSKEPPSPILLEHFLRNLCSLVYISHPFSTAIAELAIHVQ